MESATLPVEIIEHPAFIKNFPTAGLDELRVDAQTLGNLMIYFDAESQAHVIAAGEFHLLPQTIERINNALVIESRNLSAYLWHGQHEKIVIEVHVPRHTKVNVQMLAGVVILHGGEGDVTIRGGAGEVSGTTHARNVNVRLRNGDVTLNDLPGIAKINMSVGGVTLRWSELRGTEQIDVRCGLGGIDFHLPTGFIAAPEDIAGFQQKKSIQFTNGTTIQANIGFGGLDIKQAIA